VKYAIPTPIAVITTPIPPMARDVQVSKDTLIALAVK